MIARRGPKWRIDWVDIAQTVGLIFGKQLRCIWAVLRWRRASLIRSRHARMKAL